MIAFAGNSVFARLGLNTQNAIDPASYSLIRLVSGALVLTIFVSYKHNFSKEALNKGNWISGAALFGYAAAFSFAYVNLETGLGALILFSCVQGTMIGWALIQGERPSALEWLGLIIAFGAFVWLVSPGLEAPDPFAAGLMVLSGIAWGIYSIKGKHATDALAATTGNFILSVPFAVLLIALTYSQVNLDTFGIIMAIGSGALTSALGYALWYNVLTKITQTQAAIVQLSVPIIAGIGGALFSGEAWTMRFIISSILILGGVSIAILAKSKKAS